MRSQVPNSKSSSELREPKVDGMLGVGSFESFERFERREKANGLVFYHCIYRASGLMLSLLAKATINYKMG
jgi:hypothetical protein